MVRYLGAVGPSGDDSDFLRNLSSFWIVRIFCCTFWSTHFSGIQPIHLVPSSPRSPPRLWWHNRHHLLGPRGGSGFGFDLAKWWAMTSRSDYKKMAAFILGELSCSFSLSLSDHLIWGLCVLRGDWHTEDLRAPVDSSSQLASHLSEPAWNWILCSQVNLQVTVASSNVFMRYPELESSNWEALRNYEIISIGCCKSLSVFY